jgi:hypothetical protein
MTGSFMFDEAESMEEVRKMVESDILLCKRRGETPAFP